MKLMIQLEEFRSCLVLVDREDSRAASMDL